MDYSQCEALVGALRSYQSSVSEAQVAQSQHIIEFIRSCGAPWRRSTLQGHLTASAWIVDSTHQKALLVHHKKLNKWLQPGGHVDDEDATLVDAALREAREETGLTNFQLIESIYDVDVHPIPARADEPAHFHYDIRICLVANDDAITLNAEESHALRWFPMRRIATDPLFDESVRRMAALPLRSTTQATTTRSFRSAL
jgi:8-oxo-dGTP pyrophosphatase MutT (NUDIX family)